MTVDPQDELVTLEYVATALGVTRRSVERMIAAKLLPVVRVSRKTTRVRRLVLHAFITARESDQTRQ